MKLHPIYIEKDGVKEYVVLPISDFDQIQELIQDAEDLAILKEAEEEEKDKPSISLSDVKKQLK